MNASRKPWVIAVAVLFAGCSRPLETKTEGKDTTAASTRTPGASATSVSLPGGATSLVVQGKLERGAEVEYVFGEEAGDLVLAHALAPKQELEVSVYRADTGAKLSSLRKNPSFWMGRLPATLGYLVVVRNPGDPTSFSLEIEAPRRLYLDDTKGTATITKSAPEGASVAYVIPKASGKKFSAALTSAPPDSFLTLNRLEDGKPLLGAKENAKKFEGDVSNQETILRIHPGAGNAEFTLAVKQL